MKVHKTKLRTLWRNTDLGLYQVDFILEKSSTNPISIELGNLKFPFLDIVFGLAHEQLEIKKLILEL